VQLIRTAGARAWLLACALAVCGCAATHPMGGSSAPYTRDADPARYASDLSTCRSLASSTGLGAEVVDMAANAAILAGTFFYALGGGRVESLQVAGASGLLVLFTGGQDAAAKREAIVQACMRERGVVPAAPQLWQPPSAAMTVAAAPPDPSGPDKYLARKLAMDNGCHPQPVVNLAAREPGVETYTVACMNGDVLKMQCQYGNCRAVR